MLLRSRANIRALSEIIRGSKLKVVENHCDWIEENISTSQKISSAEKDFVKLDPHQRPIVEAIFNPSVREVTIVGPQQTGKSFPWQVALACKASISGVTAMCVYESDNKAGKVNKDVITPLFESDPILKRYLERAGSYSKEAYHFPNSIVYYQGSGQEISSFEVEWAIASEVDRWVGDTDRQEHTLGTFRDRIRRYNVLKRSKFIKESSPDLTTSPSWVSFRKSNKGFYNVRCLHCSGLISSYKVDGHLHEGKLSGGMQFLLDAQGNIREDSISYECYHCKQHMYEPQAKEMNEKGTYVFKNKEQTLHCGFQFGALVGYRSISWLEICEYIHAERKTNDVTAQRRLDNSIKGLPYKQRKLNKKRQDLILSHRYINDKEFNPDDLSALYFSADTQKNCWYYVVRGLDKYMNTHLIAFGTAKTEEELLFRWNENHYGLIPVAGIIDQGGGQGRSKEVQRIVQADETGCLFSYKGGAYSDGADNFKISKNDPTLILANASFYKADMLRIIYDQEGRENYYWFLPSKVDRIYLSHMLAPRPLKDGAQYKDWKSGAKDNITDDYFDCEKMNLVIQNYVEKSFSKDTQEFDTNIYRHDMPFLDFEE